MSNAGILLKRSVFSDQPGSYFFEVTKKRDIEDVDLTKFYSSLVSCNYECCQYEELIEESLDMEETDNI